MRGVINTADSSNLYYTVSNTLLHFMGNSASNNSVDGKGKMFQKTTNAQMHVVQHADRNVIHQYLLGKKVSLDEERYKNIIITNILVPVEYFYVSHIRKLLLIQTSGGILATNLDELGHSCSVIHYMIEFSSLNSRNKTSHLRKFQHKFLQFC